MPGALVKKDVILLLALSLLCALITVERRKEWVLGTWAVLGVHLVWLAGEHAQVVRTGDRLVQISRSVGFRGNLEEKGKAVMGRCVQAVLCLRARTLVTLPGCNRSPMGGSALAEPSGWYPPTGLMRRWR